MAYITIDNIIRSYIADKQQDTLHGYLKYLKWGFEGLRKWNKRGVSGPVTRVLKMDGKKSVKFPEDMINWSKLGMKMGDRIFVFTPDNNIALHHDQSDGYKKANGSFSIDMMASNLFEYQFVNFRDVYGTFGVLRGVGNGHNGHGYFRVNEKAREFQFSSDVRTTDIYLEYLSDGFDPNTETEVDENIELMIRRYIDYMETYHRYGAASAETQWKKREYMNEIDEIMQGMNDLDRDSINQILRRTTKLNK